MPKRNYEGECVVAGNEGWCQIAKFLLGFVNKKEFMVCVDLDYTLWPICCFDKTLPPYHLVENSKNERELSVSYVSPVDNEQKILSLYPEAKSVLSFCREEGIRLSICSKSQLPTASKGILDAVGLWSYFEFPQIYNMRKSNHFKMLKEYTGLEYKSFLFFDDSVNNVEICGALGVVCERVSQMKGLCSESFIRGLSTFVMRAFQASNTLPCPIPCPSVTDEVCDNDCPNPPKKAPRTELEQIKPIIVCSLSTKGSFSSLLPRRMSGINLENLSPLQIDGGASLAVKMKMSPIAVYKTSRSHESEDSGYTTEECNSVLSSGGEDDLVVNI